MISITKPEIVTQKRVINIFQNQLHYTYLGNWSDRENNSNIEEHRLSSYLIKNGYTKEQTNRALDILQRTVSNPTMSLYEQNKKVYALLRYGVHTKTVMGKPTETVNLINWQNPEKNEFAIAEEVTLKKGKYERRPDLVLYVNGIALAVIELKNSRVNISEGIGQLISNQRPDFNQWFFTTIQIVFAGNDSEGLQYGTIGTEEKYFLKWKEDEQENSGYKLDKYLIKMCEKNRLIELMHDFVLFDAGIKKLPRAHQYFGIKAAQDYVRKNQGGIIWHTQGSGKSIVMVLLAQWILENITNARIVIITDREELDEQISGVFSGAGETIVRSKNGRHLMELLGQATPRLLCSLVHKFGPRGIDNFEKFIEDIKAQPTKTMGNVFVFVDECHRTQSGKLHLAMKAIMSNAVFIGFTGTPLLKQDKATSGEVFGGYIHTYKFSEAVDDGVVLDLMYEARDIDQKLGSEDRVDAWFDAKTKALNDWQKNEIKIKWVTMQKVLSSKSRMERVVSDVVFDFSVKPRLSNGRGNAILVASSIYEACKYYTLFKKTELNGRSAIVTSYNPQTKDITKEDTGANTETDKEFIYNTYMEVLKNVVPKQNMTKTETYELEAKRLFKKEPVNMKLLVVVDKLLTGFDAPPCTYIYLDKNMRDHALFQAICRTNRLDGADKDFGYIVDYKDLFNKVENAISVYSSELDASSGGADPQIHLQERLKKGRERLEQSLEALVLLCEPVLSPRGDLEHIHYFCGNSEIKSDLQEHEYKRSALYKSVANFVRSFSNISDELIAAGCTSSDIVRIKKQVDYYLKLRDIIKNASGESLDLKTYEADMRHLIDTYIDAYEPRKISPFDDISLLELVVKKGVTNAVADKLSCFKENKNAIAETIENNVRKMIVKEQLTDPEFYEKISGLLDVLIADRKAKAIEYEEYLKKIEQLAKKMKSGKFDDTPTSLDTQAKRALYNNLDKDESLALEIYKAILRARPDDWRGNIIKEKIIKAALFEILKSEDKVDNIFSVIKNQKEF